ncbi:MAG: homoserine O-acetyltransferase [Oscillospiraceae bacterium]|nr:homoserine O-acetyltransferase [Oscillospiraceae bacterium]
MIVEKKIFQIPSFTFQNGRTLPVTIGYETYGNLSPEKDNVILVVHYFSASSHCAGKYTEEDALSGFWDGLIGPGKAVDTDKYFVVCADNLCNCGVKNPMIHTTGPMTINPDTGKYYGLDFPVPEVLDVVNTQKALLESMGISHLHAVMGPSFGGMSSWQWAVAYPDWMDCIIPVISTPKLPVWGGFNPLQYAIRVAKIDPKYRGGNYYDFEEQPEETLHLALEMMNVAAFQAGYYERTYKRETDVDKECLESLFKEATFEKKLDDAVNISQPNVDLNHWLYTCRMCLNFDVSRPYGGDLDAALSRIKCRVLAIPCKEDILHPASIVNRIVDRITCLGGNAQSYTLSSDYGHMAGILQTDLYAEKVREFLN